MATSTSQPMLSPVRPARYMPPQRTAAMATPAIAQCALVYKDGKAAKEETSAYYEALLQLAPDAIGGKLPDEGFWL